MPLIFADRIKRHALCLLLLLCLLSSPGARAEDNPPPPDSAAAHFQAVIKSLSADSGIAIVAEGAPLAFDAAITTGTAYAATPTETKVALLADAANYDARKARGVFLLQKRYSNPRDIPCVTISECRASLREVASLLSGLMRPVEPGDTTDSREPYVQSFFRSLSPEQVAAMENTPLPLARLTPAQKDKASDMLVSTYLFDLSDTARYAAYDLSELPNGALHKATWNDAVISWNEKSRPDVERSLSDQPLNYGNSSAKSTAPTSGYVMPAEAPSTLGEEFARLNRLAKLGTGVTFELGDGFADKPVTVVGLDRLTPEQAAFALASVYDLRVRHARSGEQIIARPCLSPVNIGNVKEAILGALPSPLARILTNKTPDKLVPKADWDIIATVSLSPDDVKKTTIVLYLSEAVRLLR